MPFTLSHVAAVVPLRRLGLPVAGLVVGSMTPDWPIYVGIWSAYDVTHSALGVITIDPLVATFVVWLWTVCLRTPLIDVAPEPVRTRLARIHRMTRREWLLLPVAGALGSATHVVWDELVHSDGWGSRHIPWLTATHAGATGSTWAQAASTVFGLAVVAVWMVLHVARAARRPAAARLMPAWTGPAGAAVVVAVGATSGAVYLGDGLVNAAFHTVVSGMVAACVVAVLVVAAWWAVARRRGPCG